MGWLDAEELRQVQAAELSAFPAPIPTQSVSSDEFMPAPQTEKQREFEARIKQYGAELARHQGMSRRAFFKTAAGMAAAFVAMNDTYGPLYEVSRAEAATPELASERAGALSQQFIMDMHTHFLRDDTRLNTFVRIREAVGKAGWNPDLVDKPQTLEDLKFDNYIKEIFVDSDTKVACISGAPSDVPGDWFLTNEMKAEARAKVNQQAGTRRMMAHAIFTPGQPGWLEQVDRAIAELKPDSFKGYTIGDNTHKDLSKYPWHLDDEKLVYPFYERCAKAGLVNICIHKGLFAPSTEKNFPHLLAYADVRDVGKAAQDWPQLNFIIYHSGYRFIGRGVKPDDAWAQFEQTGRVEWVSDLADIPERYGVTNVYGDLGQIFAQSTMAHPKLCAAMMGILIRGLGADHVCWGSDAIWTGSPQWQIEALRRLEIPEDLQKQHGFKPLGPADGPVKSAILGTNNARLYNYPIQRKTELSHDRFAQLRARYEQEGVGRSNLTYGYVHKHSG
jgi:predicted TIM-barrel fold metal-dependent hydrolase